jgi:hypothetical protein
MSNQLDARLDELKRERARLEEAVRRIGESVASNLDRDALLELVVHAALDGVDATGGRATALDPPSGRGFVERARGPARRVRGAHGPGRARGARHRGPGGVQHRRRQRPRLPPAPLGGRRARARDHHRRARGAPGHPERAQALAYFAGQAAVSIENVDLHELVQRQAVTDELTGLSNHRRFQEVITQEVERSKRFGQELGLVMLDIDHFKAVK